MPYIWEIWAPNPNYLCGTILLSQFTNFLCCPLFVCVTTLDVSGRTSKRTGPATSPIYVWKILRSVCKC